MPMSPNRWFSLLLCSVLLAGPVPFAAAVAAENAAIVRAAAPAAAIDVHVDTRVELAGIMARLAGYEEYQAPGIASYDRAVEAYFGRFRDHPSIALMKKLREARGIAYNAPVEMALLATPGNWQPAVQLEPWPDFLDQRWDARSAADFLDAARAFERESRAARFFAEHRPLYAEVEAAVKGNLAQRLDADWYLHRLTRRAITGFTVIPGLLDGPNSYGPHVRYRDGREIVYGVLATPPHREGQAISYPADAQLALLVHEFHHSYMNAWADEHMATLLPAAQTLFEAVKPRMQELAYGEARILLYESLVRAQTQRYLRHHGEDDVLRRAVAEDQGKGFPWVPALAGLFDSLDQGQGIAFDAGTAARVAALLDDWGRDDGARVAAEQQRLADVEIARLATGPQILAYTPAQDAVVGADLEVLEIRFDRPMAPALAIFGDVPEVAGKPSWDESHQVLRLPVRVRPGASYQLLLNNEDTLKMQSAAGEPLIPRSWKFRVRASGE